MNLIFTNIIYPKIEFGNRDKVVGHLPSPGGEVVVERVVRGWTVELRVTVEGRQFHADVPTAEEKYQFAALFDRAELAAVHEAECVRRRAMRAGREHLLTK